MEADSEEKLGYHSLETYITIVAANEDLADFTYDVKPDAKAGGYTGILNRVTLKGKRRDGSKVSFSLVYKDQPNNEFRREQFRLGDFYANEAAFYNTAIPAFERLQDRKGIRSADRFVSYPKCYFAGEVVVLQDMSPLGFRLGNRQKPLDLDHCRLVMREMGILHAFSFALRDQNPIEFARVKTSVKEVWVLPPVGGMKEYWDTSTARAYAKYVEISSKDSKYATALKKYCDNCFQMMEKAVDGAAAEPYAVVGHGDCWTNNYLFKYAEDSNLPEALCFIDFQLSRYSTPVCDLMYFISCCTSKETRAQHYDDLLKEYHGSLSSFLWKLGSDPERLFPFTALQDQLQRFGSFGVGMAILALPVVADDPDVVPDLNSLDADSMGEFGASENPLVWRRFADVVEDMVDFGYIK